MLGLPSILAATSVTFSDALYHSVETGSADVHSKSQRFDDIDTILLYKVIRVVGVDGL